MIQHAVEHRQHSMRAIKALTFFMFMMFAMTTDSVGIIIPRSLRLSAQHDRWRDLSVRHHGRNRPRGFFLGHLRTPSAESLRSLRASRICCRIVPVCSRKFVRLLLHSACCIRSRYWRVQTGALALIGDLSKSTKEHTALMNRVEGFFGVGSIIGLDSRSPISDRCLVERTLHSGWHNLCPAALDRVASPYRVR